MRVIISPTWGIETKNRSVWNNQREREKKKIIQTDRQTNKDADRNTDRDTDKDTDKDTDRDTDRHTDTDTQIDTVSLSPSLFV